jgi:tryptophan synthase alpha chain
MTDRIAARFERCRREGRAALITFLTVGDPDLARSAELLDAAVAGGADIVELGMPFTDPMADGPAIQQANLRSLKAGTRTADILALASRFRAAHPEVPLVVMGYANPMLARGARWFADALAAAGVDGVICVDLPPEEDQDLGPDLRAAGIHLIRLATPTTDAQRLPAVLDGASGFLYHVAVAGVTGAGSAAIEAIAADVGRLKRATDLPVVVGFGVRTPAQAAGIAALADGVVVGSAIVSMVGAGGPDLVARVRGFVAELAGAMRRESQAA